MKKQSSLLKLTIEILLYIILVVEYHKDQSLDWFLVYINDFIMISKLL